MNLCDPRDPTACVSSPRGWAAPSSPFPRGQRPEAKRQMPAWEAGRPQAGIEGQRPGFFIAKRVLTQTQKHTTHTTHKHTQQTHTQTNKHTHTHKQTNKQINKHTDTHRLESKRPRVNEGRENNRLGKCSHAISDVWEKRHSEDLGRQERDRGRHLCNSSSVRL